MCDDLPDRHETTILWRAAGALQRIVVDFAGDMRMSCVRVQVSDELLEPMGKELPIGNFIFPLY